MDKANTVSFQHLVAVVPRSGAKLQPVVEADMDLDWEDHHQQRQDTQIGHVKSSTVNYNIRDYILFVLI